MTKCLLSQTQLCRYKLTIHLVSNKHKKLTNVTSSVKKYKVLYGSFITKGNKEIVTLFVCSCVLELWLLVSLISGK